MAYLSKYTLIAYEVKIAPKEHNHRAGGPFKPFFGLGGATRVRVPHPFNVLCERVGAAKKLTAPECEIAPGSVKPAFFDASVREMEFVMA